MSLDADALYTLLPAVYRTRDAEAGGALQALFGVFAQQSAVVEENIRQLYDDQFIETCAPWAIPYIGDLLGYNSIYALATGPEPRAEVADTIGSRRRKGTRLALEQVAADTSGRVAVVVEEFARLLSTESMRRVDPGRLATADLRNGGALDRLGTAFDTLGRTIDVRRIAPRYRTGARPDPAPLELALHGPGRYDIPEVAIHLWRVSSWPVLRAPAFAVDGERYRFSPLGADMPLFSRRPERTPFDHLSTRADVPAPIGRHELLDFYGAGASVQLFADGEAVEAAQIEPANLADRPGGAWCEVAAGRIAVDPELGRIQFAADLTPPGQLEVSYCYGFPAALGGGVYDRTATLAPLTAAQGTWWAIAGSPEHPTLADAVQAWNGLAAGSQGVIVVPGPAALTEELTGAAAVRLPAGSSLVLATATLAAGADAAEAIWTDALVTLTGDIEVTGVPAPPAGDGSSAAAGQLLISGPWIAGRLRVTGAPCIVQVCDATLVPGLALAPDRTPREPGEPSIVVQAPASTLILNRAISGPIAADTSASTRVCASILDATGSGYVAYGGADPTTAGGDLHIEDSTVIGKVRTRTLTLASNTIFDSRLPSRDPWPVAVWAARRQAGCVRFCSLPSDAITPRRYACLPPDAASEAALAPAFVSLAWGSPSYALLSGDCPVAVWTGAANGSQLGAYLQIAETEAVSNVQLRAPEYLPALLESGVFIHPSRPEPVPALPGFPYGYGPPGYGTGGSGGAEGSTGAGGSGRAGSLRGGLPGIGAELI